MHSNEISREGHAEVCAEIKLCAGRSIREPPATAQPLPTAIFLSPGREAKACSHAAVLEGATTCCAANSAADAGSGSCAAAAPQVARERSTPYAVTGVEQEIQS